MTRMVPIVLLVIGMVALACNRSQLPARTPDAATDLAVAYDLATSGRGRCWRTPNYATCDAEGHCPEPPFISCQEGMCCSGEVDPATCICHCNGGPPCEATVEGDSWCCRGGTGHNLTDRGVLKCRLFSTCDDWAGP